MIAGTSRQAAAQAVASSIASGRVTPVFSSKTIRSKNAFKPSRKTLRVSATAESAAPAPRAQKTFAVKLEDIKPDDVFEGTVVSVEAYGAFVDFGARASGLVHVSQLADKFIKNVSDVVQKGDKVSVRVLSVDPKQGRIALSMKGMGGAAAEASYADEDDDAEEVADAGLDLDGFAYEALDEEVIADEDEIEFENDFGDAAEYPSLELVTGTVVRVEQFGAFVEFQYNGQTLQGLLPTTEMKAPAAVAAALETAAAEEGEEAPAASADEFSGDAYVEMDITDATAIYKVGDMVSCFILGADEENSSKIELTQYLDEEMDGDDEVALTLGEAPLDQQGYEGADEDVELEEEPAMDVEAMDAMTLQAQVYTGKINSGTSSGGVIADKNGNLYTPAMFPDRPVARLHERYLLTKSSMYFEDDDGDDSDLVGFYSDDYKHLPKDTLKKLGYKWAANEEGEMEVVNRDESELPSEQAILDFLDNPGLDAQVDAWVSDLLDDEEDEAELPARAYRAPVIAAAAVEPEISAAAVKQLRTMTGAGMMDCKKALKECAGDAEAATEWLRKKGLAGADKKAGRLAAEGVIATYIHPGSRLGVMVEVNCETDFVAASDKFLELVNEVAMIIAASPEVSVVSADDVPAEVLEKERQVEMGKEDLKSKPEAVRAKIVEGRLEKIKKTFALMEKESLRDPSKTVTEAIKETIAAVGENIKIRRFVKFNLGEGLEKKANDFAAEVAEQTQKKEAAPKPKEEPKAEAPKEEAKPAVAVSASVVKELREKTGAGMMDCKKALAANNNDMDAATEWLRKKGLASADKKAGRLAAEGVIASYIHPGSRLGVLIEVNCETDFVAVSDKFQQLVSTISMQIAASPSVMYVAAEDIPAEVFEREKQIEMEREDIKSKPEAIRAKIAEGRVQKLAKDMCLLEQPYLVNQDQTVADAIKEAIAAIGEKIAVRRFERFNLGEGLEKKSNDFAAEVAAVTGSA